MTDQRIAELYVSKISNAKSRNIEFNLSFTSFKNMMRAKRCKYTGILLTSSEPGKSNKPTDRTIERLDATKGYIKGNCCVVCFAANQWKSYFENDNSILTIAHALKILNRMKKIASQKTLDNKPTI